MAYRGRVLEMLGERRILTESESLLYQRGSAPIKDGEEAIALERLLAALEESHERIATALEKATAESLEAKLSEGEERTIGERIEFLQWHETYHVGQLEILRQLAGKNDAVI